MSRIILNIENQVSQIMINYFISITVNMFTLEYDGLKYTVTIKAKNFSINELEKIVLEKTKLI